MTGTDVVYLTFTRTGDRASGTVQVADRDADPTKVVAATEEASAVFAGPNVTVSVGGSVLGTNLTGTLSGGVLTLNVPQQNGTLESLRMRSATVSAYNQAVDTLNQEAAAAGAAKQQQQQAADQQHNADAQVTSAISTVEGDLNDLQSLEGDLATDGHDAGIQANDTDTDLHNLQTDYGYVQRDLASDPQQVCGDAQEVQSDLTSLTNDASSLTTNSGSADVTKTQTLLGQLPAAFQALAAAEQQDPTYVATGPLPRPSDQQTAATAAQAALSAYQAAENTATSRANSDVSTGRSLDQQASTNCP